MLLTCLPCLDEVDMPVAASSRSSEDLSYSSRWRHAVVVAFRTRVDDSLPASVVHVLYMHLKLTKHLLHVHVLLYHCTYTCTTLVLDFEARNIFPVYNVHQSCSCKIGHVGVSTELNKSGRPILHTCKKHKRHLGFVAEIWSIRTKMYWFLRRRGWTAVRIILTYITMEGRRV